MVPFFESAFERTQFISAIGYLLLSSSPAIIMSEPIVYQESDIACIDSGSTSGTGKKRAAPYGQACLHCFKTKSKCVKQSSGESCQRCIRLKKQCSPADSLRKRPYASHKLSREARETAMDVARLKAQVADLESLLHKPMGGKASEKRDPHGDEIKKEKDGWSQSESGGTSITSSDGIWALSLDEEQARLDKFRDRMLRFFAFMHLPPSLTAKKLRQDRPHLFQAIMAVSSPTTKEKRARGAGLKALLAHNIIEETDATIDLLLCILTYIAWGFDRTINAAHGSPSHLTQMALSLVYNLRLNKAKPMGAYVLPKEIPKRERSESDILEGSTYKPLERQRAALGCFLMCSMVSSSFGQSDPIRWTPQLQEYLDDVGRNKDCSTDEMFAFQVRLQLLIQKAHEQRDKRELNGYRTVLNTSTSTESPNATFLLEVFHDELRDIETSIPPSLKNDANLISHLHYALLSINETIYPANPDFKREEASISPHTMEQVQCHEDSLSAIRTWFDKFFEFPVSDWIGFSFPSWMQMSRCLIVLFRLSITPYPERNSEAWRQKKQSPTTFMPLFKAI
ncbi:hypothetical protein BJX99DRAFT_221749 [Aspergillus californicus]